MRKYLLLAGLAVFAAGCGDDKKLNTTPMTDEQKAASKAESQAVDDEELSGSGTAAGKKKKGK